MGIAKGLGPLLSLMIFLPACKNDCADSKAVGSNQNLAAQCQADLSNAGFGSFGGNVSTSPSTLPLPPQPLPSTSPLPSPPPAPVPSGQRDIAGVDESTFFQQVAYATAAKVDSYYPQSRELLVQRSADVSRFQVDQCDPALNNRDTFADRIAYAVNLKTRISKAELGYVASVFHLNTNQNTFISNSLISHPLCNVTVDTLKVTYDGVDVPSQMVVDKMNRFNDLHNQYRQALLAGDANALLNLNKLWSKFFMCLGYMESLTLADSTESDQVADRYAWRRPAGVNMHDDLYQSDPASVLGIGVFQFAPDVQGDIRSCVLEWNQLYPKCQIDTKASWQQMLNVIGSAKQTFNAFCAAAKVTAMFSVQLNSTDSVNTHPANLSRGLIKSASEKCVSPFMNVRRSYNHFGPLQNVHKTTAEQVLTCTLKN